MMKIFRKKQASVESVIPVDKSNAIPGFTMAIRAFGKAQEKMEPDFIPIYLYVMENKTGNPLCYLSTTFFAKINNHPKQPEHGFSIFFNKTMLGNLYGKFVNSEVAKVFTKEKGIIDSPGCLHQKCEYYIKDFGYDAEEASAVITLLLKDVFSVKPEDVTLHIQLFGWDEEKVGQESTIDFDYEGNVIAKSGFKHDLF